mgnify:CR=1 FL=1
MVRSHLHHQYRIGPQGSAYSTVTSTTAASTLRTASIRQERSCTKLAKPKHKPEPPTAQCHFRYGRAAKQVYEKGGEEITQIEWETLNKSLRKTLRMLEHRDAERQALATARLATEFKDFTPKIPCPEYASDYQALLAISRASDPRMWRKGMNDGWVDLEKQSNKVYIKEGTVAACRGVTCAPLRIADKLFRVIRELYLPGLELGDAAPPPFVQISQLRHLETLVLADNGFGAGKELANGDTYHSVLDDHLADFDLPSLKVLDLTGVNPSSVDLSVILGIDSIKSFNDTTLQIFYANGILENVIVRGIVSDTSSTNELIDSLRLNGKSIEAFQQGAVQGSVDLTTILGIDSIRTVDDSTLRIFNANGILEDIIVRGVVSDTSDTNELLDSAKLVLNENSCMPIYRQVLIYRAPHQDFQPGKPH